MKQLLSLLMIGSLGITSQFLDAGCATCNEPSSPKLTRRQRRERRLASKKVQAKKTKTTKKAAPAATPTKKTKKAAPAKAGTIHHVSSKADLDALKAKGKTVVVKYSADWCGACTMIADYFKNLAGEFDEVIFAHVDIDKDSGLSSSEGVKALPTIHVHKAGKKAGELVGANKDALRKLVKKHA